jgi:hypothetical protein
MGLELRRRLLPGKTVTASGAVRSTGSRSGSTWRRRAAGFLQTRRDWRPSTRATPRAGTGMRMWATTRWLPSTPREWTPKTVIRAAPRLGYPAKVDAIPRGTSHRLPISIQIRQSPPTCNAIQTGTTAILSATALENVCKARLEQFVGMVPSGPPQRRRKQHQLGLEFYNIVL